MNSGFKDALNDSGLTMYSLAKQTGIPYTTINRLVNERLSINNCNAGAVFKIASALGVRMEVLMNDGRVYTLEEIAERIAPVARKYNIPKVYVFGSYARGEADPDSDVDLNKIAQATAGCVGADLILSGVYFLVNFFIIHLINFDILCMILSQCFIVNTPMMNLQQDCLYSKTAVLLP